MNFQLWVCSDPRVSKLGTPLQDPKNSCRAGPPWPQSPATTHHRPAAGWLRSLGLLVSEEPPDPQSAPWQIQAVPVAKSFFWDRYSSLGDCGLAAPCAIPPGDAPGWNVGRDTLLAVRSEGSVPSFKVLSPCHWLFLLLQGCVPSSLLPPCISNGNPKWECPCCPSPGSPTLGELHPPSSASTCLFLILDVIEGGKCDRKEGRLFFFPSPAKYGLTLKIQIVSAKGIPSSVCRGGENDVFWFSSWEVSQGVVWSPCREPQEFTELVHRTALCS